MLSISNAKKVSSHIEIDKNVRLQGSRFGISPVFKMINFFFALYAETFADKRKFILEVFRPFRKVFKIF